MALEPILIDGKWEQSQDPIGTLYSYNPAKKEQLQGEFPVSNMDELERMLQAAWGAVLQLRETPTDKIADFLDAYADKLDANKDVIVEIAHLETALPAGTRLPGELNRTTNQLRQAADAVRDRTWTEATIDTAAGIRSMLRPLAGAVIVFGPNNFPLAFNGVGGGDFAAAIAAGCPVIAKANPGHLCTTKVLAEIALDAINETGVPQALVQMFYRSDRADGLKLVSHPLTAASAFTGSKAGMKLKEAADAVGKPIYLEMSAVNPMVILPGALDERLDAVADELYASCSLGVGQFCTKPGLVIVPKSDKSDAFIDAVAQRMADNPPGVLLTEKGPGDIEWATELWDKAGAELVTGGERPDSEGFSYANTLYKVDGATFLKNPHDLQTEAFGVVSLIVVPDGEDELMAVLNALEGSLGGGVYTDTNGADDALYNKVEPILRTKVGRLLNDKMPTGVAVSPAMNHGGPFPATGHPGWTAVGIPASIKRFAMLCSYDNVRPHRLPEELQDKNPNGKMFRFIDREWTRDDVG